MMNGIAISFVAWALNGPAEVQRTPAAAPTWTCGADNFADKRPRSRDLGQFLGIGPPPHLSLAVPDRDRRAGARVWFLFRRMRLGYEARAVGVLAGLRTGGRDLDRRGPDQAVPDLRRARRAGRACSSCWWNKGALVQNYEAQLGFTGIAVAFLGQNNPIGIIFAAIFWGVLSRGETALQLDTELPREFVDHPPGHPDHRRCRDRVPGDEAWVARRQLAREGESNARRQRAAIEEPEGEPRRRGRREGGRLMDLDDLGAAIQIAFTYFTILYLTGLGGLFSERSGIVNIGLEGMMMIGTVTGLVGRRLLHERRSGWGRPWGPRHGPAVRAGRRGAVRLGSTPLATITFRVDHIVSGVVINLVAIGLARFLSHGLLRSGDPVGPGPAAAGPDRHPVAVALAVGLGARSRSLSPMVLVACPAGVPVWYSLYRTRWGLRLRSCGENPEATRSLGVAVAPLPVAGRAALRSAGRAWPARSSPIEVSRVLARGTDAGARVHRAGGLDPVELEPRPADGGGVPVRVRAGDPAAARRLLPVLVGCRRSSSA